MNQKTIIGLGVIIAIATLLVCNDRFTQTNADTKIIIGANLSLTGSMPYWSSQLKNGMNLALKNLHEDSVKIIYEDNQGSAKGGIAAFRKLCEHGVSVVITAHTSVAVPQQTLAAQENVPLVGTVVGVSNFGEKNKWSFIDWPAHEDVVPPLVKYMTKTLNCHRAAILVVNDDYGSNGARVFSSEFERAGGVISGHETIMNTEKNIRPVLTKILTSDVDSLYTITREETLLNVIKQARALGFKGAIVGDHAMASSIIDKGLSRDITGIYFCGSAGIVEIEKVAPDFVSGYVKQYGENPDWVALYGYSMLEYLIPCVKAAKGDRNKTQETLSKVSMKTARGMLSMSANRKVNTTCVVYARENGKFIMK